MRWPISPLSYVQCKAFHLNGVQTELKCKPNVKRCKRFVFVGHSPLLHHNTLKTKAITLFQADHILTRFVFPPLYIIFRRKEQSMKGSMSHFLQAILNDILKNKEEKFQATEEELQNTTVPLTVLSEQVKENNNEPTQQKQTVTKEDEDFIDKLNKLINDNMAGGELSIKFLTDNMAMSRASLYHKVKTLTGLGVNDYINRLRIEKSVYLLTNTNLNINEISYEVGFTYPRYFSTSFKQIKGMTPTQFKEEKKKNNTDSK